MSDTNEDVKVPIVEYDNDYDSFGEDDRKESDEEVSDSGSSGGKGYDEVDNYQANDKEDDHVYEEINSDHEGFVDSDKKKSKKKVKKAYGIDLTPPDQHLKDSLQQAKVLSSKGKNREAVMELVRAVALTRIIYGDGHWQLAQAYADVALGYLNYLSYIPQAVDHAKTAKQIMGGTVHTAKNESDKLKILEVRMNVNFILGRALAAQKKFAESEKCLVKSESIHKDWARSNRISMHDVDMKVKISIALAKVSLMQEKFANASGYYETALELVESSKGRSSKELIPIYQGLGKVELAKGRLGNSEQAISMFETAHTINTSNHKSGAVPVAETGLALANAYSSIGGAAAEASAESYLNECLTIYLTHHGPNHKSTVNVKDELIRLLMRTNRLDDGIKELKSNITSKEEVYGEFSEEVAESYKLLANVYQAKGNMEASLKAYKNCINIETMIHGTNHKHVKDAQASIDMLMANPKLAAKQPKTRQDELKERPRFSPIVKGNVK